MISAVQSLNWIAVALAIIVYFMVGGVWYPFVVRKAYARALGKEMKGGLLSLLVPLACITITTIASATFLRVLGIDSYVGALGFGLMVGLCHLTPMILNIAWNPLFPRPFYYTIINAPYFVIGNILSDLILISFH